MKKKSLTIRKINVNASKKNYAAPKKSSFAAKEPESIYKNMLKKGEQKQISLTSERKIRKIQKRSLSAIRKMKISLIK